MISRRFFIAALSGLSLSLALPMGAVQAEEAPLKIVTSFSILADMVREIGGDRVKVSMLVGPDGDSHVYEPTPTDARRLREAELLIENGLDFESWLPRLVEASGFKGTRVVASQGVKPLPSPGHEEHGHDDHGHSHHGHSHGPNDPHAWQDVANALIYARNIAAALEKADSAHAGHYKERAKAYSAKLEELDAALKARFAAIPQERRKVVTAHDAFAYFGKAYGVTFLAPEGVSTESETSAATVAAIIDQIRKEGISAIFVENITSSKLTEQIVAATGTRIGGKLYSDALSKTGQAATYIGMIGWNADQLAGALQ